METLSEIAAEIRAQGDALAEFQAKHVKRVDAIDDRLQVLGDEIKDLKINGTGGGGTRPDMSAGTPEERKALASVFRAWAGGQPSDLASELDKLYAVQRVDRKSMVTGIDPDGGWFSSTYISEMLNRVRQEVSPLLGMVRTLNLTRGNAYEEIVDRDVAEAKWVAETEGRPDTDSPRLLKQYIPLNEIYAMPKVSQTLVDVADIDVLQWLVQKIGEGFGLKQGNAIYSGDGVGKPRGFLTYPIAATADKTRPWGTIQCFTTNQSGGFATNDPADVLIDVASAMKPQYRSGAWWIMSRATAAAIRKMKTGADDLYIWQPSLQAGQPDRLLGYPVLMDETAPAMQADSLSVIFMNPAIAYTAIRRPEVKLLPDPYTARPNVRLYAYERFGGAVTNTEAVKVIKFGS